MAQPASIVNTRGQSTDTVQTIADHSGRVKLGVGDVDTGLTPHAAWQGVASHEDGAAFNASDGVVVGAGVDGAGNVVKILLDALGHILLGQAVDDGAFGVSADYVFPFGAMADETATDSVDEGDAGLVRMTLDRRLITVNEAYAKGGATAAEFISAASNNATNLKSTPGRVLYVTAINVNAAVRYLKFYDKATAPAPGTDTPKLVIPLTASSVPVFVNLGPYGTDFPTGISYALVTGISQTDNTSVAANEQLVSIGYA